MIDDESKLGIPEWLEAEALKHVVEGDLWSFENIVVPVRTGGRSGGAISDRLRDQGVAIPESVTLFHGICIAPHVFSSFWDDDGAYSDETISKGAMTAMFDAAAGGLETLAFPVLEDAGGLSFIAAAERGIQFALFAEGDDLRFPKYVFVARPGAEHSSASGM